MDNDKIQKQFQASALAGQELGRMRTPITILFTDHSNLLVPVIDRFGGRMVTTIGDAIMASFNDPVEAVRAAIGMQQELEHDRASQPDLSERIHLRIGLHTGVSDVDVDVVKVASRVHRLAQPDRILITEALVDAVKSAGGQCAKVGRTEIPGTGEARDIYEVAWSSPASDRLVEELRADFGEKLKDSKRRQEELEEEYEVSREQWRAERRRMSAEIEELEEAIDRAHEESKLQVSDDLLSEIRFQLGEAEKARENAERALAEAQARWEAERNNLKAQIDAMQHSVIEAMEQSNNPARLALAVREQVDVRLQEAKREWELQWEVERRRMAAEVERLKKSSGVNEKKDAARRALLEKLGKTQGGAGSASRTADQIAKEFQDAKIQWDIERDQLSVRIKRLELDIQHVKDEVRNEAYQELRGQYEPKLAETSRERQRFELELQSLTAEISAERTRAAERIAQLEETIPQAQEAARKQVTAELRAEFDGKIEEINRLKLRSERRLQEDSEEADAERRRLRKLIIQLEDQLKEAREAAGKPR